MNTQHYITRIMEKLRGLSGMNFQTALGEIFKVYYREYGKTYEMPSHYGGDSKNDGWVVEDALFYQIYAPRDMKNSLKSDIQNKFSSDLQGLVEFVFDQKKWNGKINQFVFIVNTRDDNLPADPKRFFEEKTTQINDKYSANIKTSVVNLDYIRDLLEETNFGEHIFIKIVSRLNILCENINEITEGEMARLIEKIAAKAIENSLNPTYSNSYKRISTPKKIVINDLGDLKEEIELFMNNINTVDSCLAIINQDIHNSIAIDKVVKHIILLYQEFSKKYNGTVLLNNIFEEIYCLCGDKELNIQPIKLLIIYIFDKCDIFEKE